MEDFSKILNKVKDKKCPVCGNPFLGCVIEVDNSSTTGIYPGTINIKFSSYPLSCGKCPECAEKCFVGNIEHQNQSDLNYDVLLAEVKKNSKIPCEEKTIQEHNDLEDEEDKIFPEEEITEFIDSMMDSVACCPYLDKFYFFPEWDTEYKGRVNEPEPWEETKDFLGCKLINIFNLIKNEIQESE